MRYPEVDLSDRNLGGYAPTMKLTFAAEAETFNAERREVGEAQLGDGAVEFVSEALEETILPTPLLRRDNPLTRGRLDARAVITTSDDEEQPFGTIGEWSDGTLALAHLSRLEVSDPRVDMRKGKVSHLSIHFRYNSKASQGILNLSRRNVEYQVDSKTNILGEPGVTILQVEPDTPDQFAQTMLQYSQLAA